MERLYFPSSLVDPGWSKPVEIIEGGLEYVDVTAEHDSIVKLEFYINDEKHAGSGFIINIPGASNKVILTAAHNLRTVLPTDDPMATVTPKLAPTTDLSIYFHDGSCVSVTESQTHVAASYRAEERPEGDYGAILLPHAAGGGRGLGFSLRLSYADDIPGEVTVIAYRDSTQPTNPPTPIQPVTSTGRWRGSYQNYLEYDLGTEKGISGGAVCIGYKGCLTVVGIHNRGSGRRNRGKQGVRITTGLLREVYRWAGVGQYNARLCEYDPKLPLEKRAYLNFSEDYDFARVRLCTGTPFDVLPAEVTGMSELYALAVEDKWVLFNTAQYMVKLGDTLSNHCLFKQVGSTGRFMKLVTIDDFELCLEREDLEEDDEFAEEQSSVTFVAHPSKRKFTKLCFV